jgi:hypothetical protein
MDAFYYGYMILLAVLWISVAGLVCLALYGAYSLWRKG